MPKVLVSNNSELLRHFASPTFRRLDAELLVAADGDEAMALFQNDKPPLSVLDAELGGTSGYHVARAIKDAGTAYKVVLVTGKRLTSEQLRKVSVSGADEVLVAPMTADELFDVVAIQLGIPRRGNERYEVSVAIGGKPTAARVSNLSVDGVRLIVPEPVIEGQIVAVTVTPDRSVAVQIKARAVWSQVHDGQSVVGAAFEDLDARSREVLARLTQWEIINDGARTRVALKGDFTEATRFDDLLTAMVGRVDFDLAQVTYMNSIGVRSWCQFLRAAPIQGYELHACSVPFVLQASLVPDVIGRGTITSFFAPYHCEQCDHQEEKLLQTAAVLAAELVPPAFKCQQCGTALAFDDLAERYFAFLARDG